MAGISDAGLAAAVSEAGGLGTIAAGNFTPDIVVAQVRKARKLTDKPFAVNIMMLSPYAEDVISAVIDERVPVIISGAGAPSGLASRCKEKGIKYLAVVPSVAIARRMEKSGADAVIAEGMEAGGHIGKITTMCLVPQVADAVSVPVVAAGGIADGRGMAAAFMLGAQGVQIGTRFLAAKECPIHQNYKDKVLKAKDIDTEVTGSITGHPVRALRNKLTALFLAAEKEELGKDEPDVKRVEAVGAGALRKAVVDGDTEYGTLMAGQIAGLVRIEQTCEEIIKEIAGQYSELLK
jgi:enoyl-[acyl-carrier protein] reductase II